MKIGPKYKIAKRLGGATFDKTQSQKFQISEARSAKSRPRFSSKSEFSRQLLEKQRVRFSYYISEKQFKNYVKAASEVKGGNPLDSLFVALETRLDNVVYRLGLAPTRQAARQMVSHGHVRVNDRKVTTPSYHVHIGNVISIRPGSRNKTLFLSLSEKLKQYKYPAWVSFNDETMEGKVGSLPKYERAEHHFDLAPVLEFYSR